MRLIDADKLMQGIRNTITEQSSTLNWLNLINRQPTAYDVDAVVERLEKEKQASTSAKAEAIIGMCGASANHYGGEECAYQRAIEIVKGGGVNGN